MTEILDVSDDEGECDDTFQTAAPWLYYMPSWRSARRLYLTTDGVPLP